MGTWEGFSPDSDAPDDFQIRDLFTFQTPRLDQMSGTWNFSIAANPDCDPTEWDCDYTFECSGFLIYKTKIDNVYTFEEGLTSGECIDGGLGEFTVLDANTLRYRFIHNQSVSRESTLKKL